jgi:hypothetical protein
MEAAMHHLMLVTLSLADGGTSEESRDTAFSLLNEDDSFCGKGGRFGSPLADWFVIGGRWSGFLRETLLGQPYHDAMEQEFPFVKGSFPSSLIEKHKDGFDLLWHRLGGTGNHPLSRSSYYNLGADDDAMLVDPILYETLLKPHAGIDRTIRGDALSDFADLDGDEADESFIDNKWIIVVDYHKSRFQNRLRAMKAQARHTNP